MVKRLSERGDQKLMDEDPLELVLSLAGKKLWNHPYVTTALIIIVVSYLQFFNFICIMDIIVYKNFIYMKYLPGVFLQQPGCFGMIIVCVYNKDFVQYQEIAFSTFWAINSGGEKTKNRILRESKIIISVCIIGYGLCTLTYMSAIPIVGDEKNLWFTVIYCEEHFERWSIAFTSIFYLCLLLIGYGSACPLIAANYIIFHAIFQFYLINDEILRIPKKDMVGRNRLNLQVMRQSTIYESLSVCAKHHVVIRMVTYNLLRKMQNALMLVFFTLSVLAFGSASCCIILDLSPSSNWRMILILATVTSMFLLSCRCGQKIIDESSQYHVTLYNTPWYHWDRRSKMALGMMIMNSLEPMRINCFGFVDLNYELILLAVRMIYSLLAIFRNFK